MSWSRDFLTELSSINPRLATYIDNTMSNNPAESMLIAWCFLKLMIKRKPRDILSRLLIPNGANYIQPKERLKIYRMIVIGNNNNINIPELYDQAILYLLRYAHSISANYTIERIRRQCIINKS